jgi:hypothetical protein
MGIFQEHHDTRIEGREQGGKKSRYNVPGPVGLGGWPAFLALDQV